MLPVVLITGAAGGFGRALTEKFSLSSWQVIAGYHKAPFPEPLDYVTQIRLDVTNRQEVATVVEQVIKEFGRIDVLINNAGINRDDLLIQAEESDWDQVHEVTLSGAFLCTQAVLPIMVRQSEGHIVNISSYAGRCGVGGQSVYAAAKAGLLGLTLAIAREYGSKNIRVNAVLPGVLPTGMTQKLSQSQREVFRQQNVLGRFNDLAEVAAMVVFLCGTRNISGQVFQLDSRIAPWT